MYKIEYFKINKKASCETSLYILLQGISMYCGACMHVCVLGYGWKKGYKDKHKLLYQLTMDLGEWAQARNSQFT